MKKIVKAISTIDEFDKSIFKDLDLGHARLSRLDLKEWISSLKDHIAYIKRCQKKK